jgi:hypothetical protein
MKQATGAKIRGAGASAQPGDVFVPRIKPQHGIPYFIAGSSANLRKGHILKTDLTARGFDTGNVFRLCEIEGDALSFGAIRKTGKTVGSRSISRPATRASAAGAK